MMSDSLLIKACRIKDVDNALNLVNDQPDYISYDGKTALIIACMNELEELAVEIIKTGKSLPNHIDDLGDTALTYACENELEEVVNLLIDIEEVDLNHVDGQLNTPLTLCASSRSEFMVDVTIKLIKSGKCEIGYVDGAGQTPLILSCLSGSSDVALQLLEYPECNPNQIDEESNTAFICACQNELEDVCLKILDMGSTIVHHIDENGDSALSISTYNNMQEISLRVMEYCTPELLNSIDSLGKTPLMWASKNKMTDVINKMLDLDYCDLEIEDEDKSTALYFCCKHTNMNDIIKRFIDLNPSLCLTCNNKGYCPLSKLCEFSNIECIEYLIGKIEYTDILPILLKYKMYAVVKKIIKNNKNKYLSEFVLDSLNFQDLVSLLEDIVSNKELESFKEHVEKINQSSEDCLICYQPSYLNYIIMPCKHVLKIHHECLSKLQNCLVCRQEITDRFQFFLI